jgi:hypothetical protein
MLVAQLQLNERRDYNWSQRYRDAVTIANAAILSGSEITFNDAVDGSSIKVKGS